MSKSLSLQALRGLAFLGIFFIHSGFIINWAGVGVSTFFVLSGFLCEKKYGNTYDKPNLKQSFSFAWNRIKKIYPLHIILMLLWALKILSYNNSLSITKLFAYIFLNVTLTQSWIPNSNINVCLNGVAWFLSTINVLYLLFPFVSNCMQQVTKKIKLIIVFVFMIILQVASCFILKIIKVPAEFYTWFMYTSPFFRFVDFYAGMCLGHLMANINDDQKITVKWSLFEIAMLLITVCLYRITYSSKTSNLVAAIYNGSSVYMLLSLIWVYSFFRKRGIITHLLSVKPLIILGNVSSYLFLIHFPVTQFDAWLFRLTENIFIISFLELIMSILLAFLYHKFKPFITSFLQNAINKVKGEKLNEIKS